jgi:hypothetical protein
MKGGTQLTWRPGWFRSMPKILHSRAPTQTNDAARCVQTVCRSLSKVPGGLRLAVGWA